MDEPEPAPPAPRAPGWVDLAAGVGILWTADLVVGVIAVAAGGREATLEPGTILLATLASFLFIAVVVGFFGCRRHGLSWREGLSLRRTGRGTVLGSIVAGAALAGLGIFLLSLFGTGKSPMSKLATQPGGLAALIVIALAAPPFEEIYYRGFLYPIFERKTGRVAAVAIATAWFTGAHVFQLAQDPVGLVPIFGMSLTATVLRAKTGSLVPALLTHGVYNGVLVVASLL